MFQVAFFSSFICVCYVISGRSLGVAEAFSTVFGFCYWFVPSYLILYAVSPMINSYIENSDSRKFRNVIIVLFVLEFFYGFMSDVGRMHCGHSAISFILLYLIARYCRLYPNWFTTRSIVCDLSMYIIFTIIPSLITCVRGYSGNMLNYDSPFVIIASLSLLFAFSKMQFKNRFVNWVASSSFAVYLLHQHSLIVPLFKRYMSSVWSHTNGLTYIAVCIGVAISLFFVATFLDKIRLFLYNSLLTPFSHD